jgi:hypothetical protein
MTNTALRRRALLLSSDDEPVDDVRTQLEDAGYAVFRCVDEGAEPYPCNGLHGGTCPFEGEGGIDVAVDVRQHPWPQPTMRELGVLCSLRLHAPVVVVSGGTHPFRDWVTSTPSKANLAAACDEAIKRSLAPVRAAAAEAVGDVMATHGVTGPVKVAAERARGRLHVHVTADLDGPVRAMAATRAGIAVRALDPTATKIEIEITP